jgi:hypothetical protein
MFSRQAEPSLVQYCMQNAEEQMLGNGIVAVGDICNTAESAAVKNQSTLYWHSFVEVTGFVPATAKTRFDQALQTIDALSKMVPARQISMAPHAPYSVSPKLFELIQNHTQTVSCMHNQESLAEETFLTRKEGDMLRLYEAIGVNIDFFEPEGNSSLQYRCTTVIPPKPISSFCTTATNSSAGSFLFASAPTPTCTLATPCPMCPC